METPTNFETKIKMVLNYLQQQKQMTSIQAINLCQCTRLAAVIHTLKSRGHNITAIRTYENKSNWTTYYYHEDTILK
jgi:prephenate dehydratase